MTTCPGKCIVGGAAIAKIYVYHPPKWEDFLDFVEDTQAEWALYQKAMQQACITLDRRYQRALQRNSQEQASIFEAQRMMLEDEDFNAQVQQHITIDHRSAIYAVMETGEYFADIFQKMDSAVMKSKAADMRDIASLVVNFLHDRQHLFDEMPEQCIVVSASLLPGELVEMDSEKVLGLVLKEASANSHLAVLAAGRRLPLLLCPDMDIQEDWNGKTAVLDTQRGALFIDADSDLQNEVRSQYALDGRLCNTEAQSKTIGGEGCRLEGFQLFLNIGHPQELEPGLIEACDGVGVFRSEFQYIGKSQEPEEESLFEDYRQSVLALKGKPLVVRTIDIGADKQAQFLKLPHENNPALGCRGLRLCFEYPGLFVRQLRAILRASAYGPVSILLPMVNDAGEVRRCKTILASVKDALRKEGHAFDEHLQVGVMVETPAAVLCADELAGEADFFSVGTNDLTQYCLAVDRESLSMGAYYNSQHPAIFKLLDLTARAAAKADIPLCVCGELAHERKALPTLVGMGYRKFSVSPAFVPMVKEMLLSLCKR